ncbi:armadillo-type protein, partial [Zopfochytrium polystomum]
QDISCDVQVDENIRLQAALQFKNGVNKHWRKTAQNCIQDDEKMRIRTRLVAVIYEPSSRLARAYAEGTAIVARMDYPSVWSDALPVVLLNCVKASLQQNPSASNSGIALRHALYTLHRVLKELYKVQRLRLSLYQLAPEFFRFLSNLYRDSAMTFLANIQMVMTAQSISPELEESILVATAALKSLRRLIVHGFPEKLATPTDSRAPIHATDDAVVSTSANDKSSLFLSKSFFTTLLGNFQKFIKLPDPVYERILLQGLKLIRFLIKNDKFNVTDLLSTKAHRHPQTDDAKIVVATSLVTSDFAADCLQTLVSRYIPLNQDDLGKWDKDPESFLTVEIDNQWQWEYSLRFAAQKTVEDLMQQHSELLAPLLIQMLVQASDVSPDSNETAILIKDAVYSSVGFCADNLFHHIKFAPWFKEKVYPEMTSPNLSWRLIRRTACNLIGSWIDVQPEADLRPLLYQLLVACLCDESSDLVVRLTAVINLRIVVDVGQETDAEVFSPFAVAAVEGMLRLIQNVDEFDTKSEILKSLESTVLMMGARVMGILAAQALREHSLDLHSVVAPAVNFCLADDQVCPLFFSPHGLDLWLALVHNANSPSSPLLSLYRHIPSLLELNSEHLKNVLRLLDCYFILTAQTLLRVIAALSKLSSLLAELNTEAALCIATTLRSILRSSFHSECKEEIEQIFLSSGILESIFKIVVGANSDTGDLVIAEFAGLIGLFALWDMDFLLGLSAKFDADLPGKVVLCYARVMACAAAFTPLMCRIGL